MHRLAPVLAHCPTTLECAKYHDAAPILCFFVGNDTSLGAVMLLRHQKVLAVLGFHPLRYVNCAYRPS